MPITPVKVNEQNTTPIQWRQSRQTAPKSSGRGRKQPAWQSQDHAYADEQTRYEDPIPSRELILSVLKAASGPMTVDQLIGHFDLSKLSQQEALGKRLGAMCRDGQLVQNRRGAFGPVEAMHLIAGRVQAHRDGFGFLLPDAGGDDLFLPPRQMRELMNGDRVLVRPVRVDERGRTEGSVVEVLERASRNMVGRLHVNQGVAYVIPDAPRAQHDILIPEDSLGKAKHGQMVVCEIIEPPAAAPCRLARSPRFSVSTWRRAWRLKSPCAPTTCRTNGPPRCWPK